MAKNYNIRTFSAHLDAGAGSHDVNIGSQVPAGMTRYVTFITVTPEATSNTEGSKVWICSTALGSAAAPAASTDTLASAAQKMAIRIASASTVGNKNVVIPQSPDTEHPLFTVASSAWLCAHLSSVAPMTSSVTLFVQYYDE